MTEKQSAYPDNLLLAVQGKSDLTLPARLSPDVRAGIEYALSSLKEPEREVLRLRYRDARTRSETGAALGIPPEQVRQIEKSAIKKLRLPARWSYIQYGIAGYLKKKADSEYQKGYNLGYRAGYRNGAEAAQSGNPHPEEDLLNLPIENLGFSTRTYHCLRLAGYGRVRELAAVSEEQAARIRNLGRKSADEIARTLQAHGLPYTAWSKYLL